jgi:hypothetical protein
MSAVDFMDSSGLGLIMGRYNTMKEVGGGITVADPNPATKKIMTLAGMERIIKIVHTSRTASSVADQACESASAAMSVGQVLSGGAERKPRAGAKKTKKEGK